MTVEGLAQMVATDFRRLLTLTCAPNGRAGREPPDLDPPSRSRRWRSQAVEAGVALREEGQNPRVDGAGPCGNMAVPPLIMWKSPWEWSYHRRSGMVANIPTLSGLLLAPPPTRRCGPSASAGCSRQPTGRGWRNENGWFS